VKIDAECHLRINEVTPCGCLVTAMVRTDTAVPIYLEAHAVFKAETPVGSVETDQVLTHYAINLRIAGQPAADVIPTNSSVELWVPTKAPNTACELPPPTYGYMLLRHLVDGIKAMPWQPCAEHEAPDDNRRPGDIFTVIASAEPGTRPEWN
jgi:hypothetical protein